MAPVITNSTRITLVSVTNDTLNDLIDLHSRVFPIAYGQKFYDEVLKAGELAKMGSILIEHIIETLRKQSDPIITSIYLHVQTVNEAAIRFYTRNGFRIQSVVPDYYKLIENRDAYILARPIFHIYESDERRQQPQQYEHIF
ncbi:hypothetical protein INT46_001441 [Mucor plumbeus]|uniref:N-acetyltransferase domain-containing protein n=1 Tax=Mucor plumbeus TaxID=97098 RepID=A0A8H7UTU6_9FUNG|nr:hypothetical protein INT46_001441 [Mucor plumbeus]